MLIRTHSHGIPFCPINDPMSYNQVLRHYMSLKCDSRKRGIQYSYRQKSSLPADLVTADDYFFLGTILPASSNGPSEQRPRNQTQTTELTIYVQQDKVPLCRPHTPGFAKSYAVRSATVHYSALINCYYRGERREA